MVSREGATEITQICEIIIARAQEMLDLNNSETIEARFIDPMLIKRFHDVETLSKRTATALAVAAVRRGELTKRAAADRLGIHPHTLDRLMTRLEESYEAELTNPLRADVLDKL